MLTTPLSVRLKTSRADIHIAAQLRSLRFRTVAIGGFASATMALDRPLSLQPDEIDYYGQVYIYDARNGRTVWEGRLEDPGRGAGADGQIWQLTALGPSAHARDRTVPLIYVDTSLTDLVRSDNGTPGATSHVGGDPGAPSVVQDALVLQFPQGLGINNVSRVVMRYLRLMESGQKLARIDQTADCGITDTNFEVEAIARTNGATASGEVAYTANTTTAGLGSAPRVILTNWTAGRNTVEWRLIRSAGGALTVPNDNYWASIRNTVVQATRYDAGGTELLTAASYTTNTVLASQIVADLLGRLLTSYDGANAVIDVTSFAIEQLAYPDGVTPAGVLDDLMRLEPGYRWGAYESNSDDLYRFEWRAWPSTVRYEATADDGFDSPGSADGLYNAVTVRWRNASGQIIATRRTSSVATLTAAGLTREALIDLGDEVGTLASAQQSGDEFLADHAAAPNAGRLTIARPIMDLERGRPVDPWEIDAAELIRVRGVQPRVDALNATARDGVTIFKIASVEYDSSRAAAVLELDSYARTTARALAGIPAQQRRR